MDYAAFEARSLRLCNLLEADPRLSEGVAGGVAVEAGIVRMAQTPGCHVWLEYRGFARKVEPKILHGPTGSMAVVYLAFHANFTSGDDPGSADVEKQLLAVSANLYRVLMDHESDPLWELLSLGACEVGAYNTGRSAVLRLGILPLVVMYKEVTP